MLRSALIVEVPEAAAAVNPWRERTCEHRPSAGAPAHVTLLFPFLPAPALDDAALAGLAGLFAAFGPFRFALRDTARFPRVLYLRPEPAAPFLALTAALARRYPALHPYAGAHRESVPHLTVAEGDEQTLAAAEADLRRALPLEADARAVSLLAEARRDPSHWLVRARFPLVAAPGGTCAPTPDFSCVSN